MPKTKKQYGGIHEIIAAAREFSANGDPKAALQQWMRCYTGFPDVPIGIAGAASALQKLGRHAEADALLTEGVQRFPDSVQIMVQYARFSTQQGSLNDAISRWQEAQRRFPDNAIIAAGLGMALINVGQIDAAEQVLNSARKLFPDHCDVAVAHAWLASKRFDWPEAVVRWRFAREICPHLASSYNGLGVGLRECGQLDEADAILGEGIKLFPEDHISFVNHAWVAHRRRDWAEAMRRWDVVRDRFGETHEYIRGRGYATAVAQLDSLDKALSTETPEPATENRTSVPPANETSLHRQPPAESAEMAELLTQFESLGNNCEFGFVQRHAGAEPLGLLRWANVPTHHLLTMLNQRFEGVGELEFTELYREINGELWIMDTRYDLRTHTFVYESEVPGERKDRFRQLMGSRFRHLRKLLVQHLESASKIFVLKSNETLTSEIVQAIYTAVGTYGPGWLLYVSASDPEHEPGSIAKVHDRLLTGHVDGLPAIDHKSWRAICKRALELTKS